MEKKYRKKIEDSQCLGLIGTFIQLQLRQHFPFPSIFLLPHVSSLSPAWRSALCVLHWLHSWPYFPGALWDRGGRCSDDGLQVQEASFLPPVQLERDFFLFLSLQNSLVFYLELVLSRGLGRECSSDIFFNRGLWPRESYSTVKWSCVGGFEWVSCTATCSRDRSPCCCSFNVLRRYRWWELTCFECQCLWIFRISIESSEIYF